MKQLQPQVAFVDVRLTGDQSAANHFLVLVSAGGDCRTFEQTIRNNL